MYETTTRVARPTPSSGFVPSWSAQQTNLARAVVDPTHHLGAPLPREPQSGRRYVSPLTEDEMRKFRSAWSVSPIACIRAMNEAIGLLGDPQRRQRYLDAALELEIAMDSERHGSERARDLVGLPRYLPDGYTDYGIRTSPEAPPRRERILVDKAQLRPELLAAKGAAIDAMSRGTSDGLEALLRNCAARLRAELDYQEAQDLGEGERDTTLRLSERLSRGGVSRRHLAILYQLRLQEAGLQSTMTKGVLRLFSLKVRHAWNVIEEKDVLALVDVGFAEDTSPFVLLGTSLADLHEKAAARHRVYCPSPDSSHRYQIRRHDSGDATSSVL